MPQYRVTIRHGSPRQQYHVEDIAADSLRQAMQLAVEHFPDAADDADLVEVRALIDPDTREFTPE
jgi:hypothetical protein